MVTSVVFENVSFSYDGASAVLLERVSCRLANGWTGVVGANGAGKSTILHLATGALQPITGFVEVSGRTIYCAQRTDAAPTRLEEFVADGTADAHVLRARLTIEADWPGRWETLSHGERKRAQIACALWQRPDVLAIDEPTNHIDAYARDLLRSALATFSGVGLLVSHDRALLDGLCRQCMFVDPPRVIVRPGGYSDGARDARREDGERWRSRTRARNAYERLHREFVVRREKAARANRERSKRGIPLHDHDAKGRKDAARVSGKDGQAGRLTRQLAGRLEHAEQELGRSRVRKTYQLGIWIPGERSRRDSVFALPAGAVRLAPGRELRYPALRMLPSDRIALTGRNGVGKTTLLRHVLGQVNVPPERVTYLPQEMTIEESAGVLEEALRLDGRALGDVMTVVNCMDSRPRRLIETRVPSPGETRKLLLALGIARAPHLIVLDEPTNHLDLPSVECLEEALDGCPCALLVVCHDDRFLERVTNVRWSIREEGPDARVFVE